MEIKTPEGLFASRIPGNHAGESSLKSSVTTQALYDAKKDPPSKGGGRDAMPRNSYHRSWDRHTNAKHLKACRHRWDSLQFHQFLSSRHFPKQNPIRQRPRLPYLSELPAQVPNGRGFGPFEDILTGVGDRYIPAKAT